MRLIVAFALVLAVLAGPAASQSCAAFGTDAGPGLGQSWPSADRDLWYATGTGSRLIPEAWYRALVRADDGTAFAARRNLARYGFRFCTDMDRDPIGFIVDSDARRPAAIGLSCAACHTGALTDGTRQFVVHGGAAAFDLQTFTTDLFAALLKLRSGPYETAIQTEDWLAFSQKVLGQDATPQAVQALHHEVSDWLALGRDVQSSIHNGGDWGFGRQDAVMVALNTVAARDGLARLPAANSPVSVPALWLTPDMARLHWTGSAGGDHGLALPGTVRGGKLLRDVSEVIGTYADVALPNVADFTPLDSSIRLDNLIRLDRALAQLSPPKWPKEWGVIDRVSADYKAGAALYAAHCAGCHALANGSGPIVDATDAPTLPAARFLRMVDAIVLPGDGHVSVGTDPMAACNTFGNATLGAGLADLSLRILWSGQATVPPGVRAILTPTQDAPKEGQTRKPAPVVADLDKVRHACADQLAALRKAVPATAAPGYSAAPLAGIFATAPYLHNGSVPNLDALLSPPKARPDQFAVGAVLFDPVKVGLGAPIKGGASGIFKVTDLRGRLIAGNANEGHAYPATPLTEVERAQLILFLKGL